MSRPYTEKELCENLIHHIHMLIDYWDNKPETSKNKLHGLAFGILAAIGSESMAVPCKYKLVADPPPEDKEYNISNNDNYVEPGMVINNDCKLHHIFIRQRN